LAALAYHEPIEVPVDLNAIDRVRRLCAAALGYDFAALPLDHGIDPARFPAPPVTGAYVLFIHSASWRTKLWPDARWRGLAALAAAEGWRVCLPWHSAVDCARANRIGEGLDHVTLVNTDLAAMAGLVAHASGVVSLETGFAHLAAALGRPAVTLYGPTGHDRHGTVGPAQVRLKGTMPCSPCRARACVYVPDGSREAPCMAEIDERRVWEALRPLLPAREPRGETGHRARSQLSG